MKYKLAIFDMDGTILDTIEDLTDCINTILSNYNLPLHTISSIKSFVGNGIHTLIERSVPVGTSPEQIELIFNDFMPYYQKNCSNKTKPYSGVIELLQFLKAQNCKTAVVSNKANSAVVELCDLYFKGLFDYAVGEKWNVPKKPAPDSVYEVLEYFHMAKTDAVYIGDSEVDIQTAQNAGLDNITVAWGFREKSFLLKMGASLIIDSPNDIKEIFFLSNSKHK